MVSKKLLADLTKMSLKDLNILRGAIDDRIKELSDETFAIKISLNKHKIKKTSKCWLARGKYDGISLKGKKFIVVTSWENKDNVLMKGIFIITQPGFYEFNQTGATKKDENGIFEIDLDGQLHYTSGDYPPEPIIN